MTPRNNLFFIVSLVLVVCGAIAFQSQQRNSCSRPANAFRRPGAALLANTWGFASCNGGTATRQATSSLAAGSATLEKESIRTVGPAVLDRPATQGNDDIVKERVREGGEAWEVRIYNDGMNTREHVARSLVQITGMTEMTAYQTMMQAHQNGIASVGRFCFEIAEMYNEGLRKQGIISDIVPVDEDS
ncbi:ATP-dependent Clp protease adaptor protein ClpS [Nitzschia inconspicua]|uniref:ATP-dependent Clp protease adaptor protein ClpS n=1 Tax=Nitzschia inconspicua TaxID=303405 RepID=A0A9K3KV02_9STRA|nr:ATP-dependent Clp protease adaptor protein ClpS [Nitzschia inconspicua]